MRLNVAAYFGVTFALILVPSREDTVYAETNAVPKTQIVLLGTGTPGPDPERFGPATAIVINGSPYLVDFGAGILRRGDTARNKGITALEPTNLKIGFLTHLHSDHTLGFPDVIFTPWVMGRKDPLEVYGPLGTQAMAEHILHAYDVDVHTRTEGL